MKINKYTATLAALGIVSIASVAQAANTVIYMTGSTACRSLVYTAMIQGTVFANGAARVVSGNNSSGASQIVYEGTIAGQTVDVDCTWSGSEAGIASTAGQAQLASQILTIPAPNGNGTPTSYNLPNVPTSYLTQASGWTTAATLPSGTNPDITWADTTQAVSLTPESKYPLNYLGSPGYVTFTLMKGYSSDGGDQSWKDLVNVTVGGMNQTLKTPTVCSFLTGNSADTDPVAFCGRNKGSGTRVNALLNCSFPVANTVDQYAWTAAGNLSDLYPLNGSGQEPGILTFVNSYASGQSLTEVSNDGFDSGGGVAESLEVDQKGQGAILIGYVGISDALTAHNGTSGTGSGPATYLSFNGVFEGDQNVINGAYPYWGLETVYGNPSTASQGGSTIQSETATALLAGVQTTLGNAGGSVTDSTKAAGACTGTVATTPKQSVLIPISAMNVIRNGDGGFPVPKS